MNRIQKTLGCGAIVYVTLVSLHSGAAATLDPAQALDLITQTADRICGVVSDKGTAESSEVKGEIRAALNGLASKLANAGLSGSGDLKSESYQNVVRSELSTMVQHRTECKERIFNTLQAKLLSYRIRLIGEQLV
jgi:hypothetical protein